MYQTSNGRGKLSDWLKRLREMRSQRSRRPTPWGASPGIRGSNPTQPTNTQFAQEFEAEGDGMGEQGGQGFDVTQPISENMWSPTGGEGFNLQNIIQRMRRGRFG